MAKRTTRLGIKWAHNFRKHNFVHYIYLVNTMWCLNKHVYYGTKLLKFLVQSKWICCRHKHTYYPIQLCTFRNNSLLFANFRLGCSKRRKTVYLLHGFALTCSCVVGGQMSFIFDKKGHWHVIMICAGRR